jgi:hypothetical protein
MTTVELRPTVCSIFTGTPSCLVVRPFLQTFIRLYVRSLDNLGPPSGDQLLGSVLPLDSYLEISFCRQSCVSLDLSFERLNLWTVQSCMFRIEWIPKIVQVLLRELPVCTCAFNGTYRLLPIAYRCMYRW